MIDEVVGLTDYIALAAGLPAFLFTAVYGIGSPWYKSWLGRNLFGLMASLSILFIVILLRRFLGEYPGYWAVSLVAYTLLAVMFWAFFINLVIERRAARPLNLPLLRKDTQPNEIIR